MKVSAAVTRELLLLGFGVVDLLHAMAWCRMAGHDEHWRKGSTTMTLACGRCGRVRSTIPRT